MEKGIGIQNPRVFHLVDCGTYWTLHRVMNLQSSFHGLLHKVNCCHSEIEGSESTVLDLQFSIIDLEIRKLSSM
jgi:hypothetical protein